MGYLILLLLLAASASGQMQTILIDDFSGGMSRLAASVSKPSNAHDLLDFDLTPLGHLAPRHGYDFVDLLNDTAGSSSWHISDIIPYYEPGDKHFIIKRCTSNDTCMYAKITIDGTTGEDSLMVRGLWGDSTVQGYPDAGANYFTWGDYLYIAHRNSPLMVFDGDSMFMACLPAPGAPTIKSVIDSAGHDAGGASGVFRYMLASDVVGGTVSGGGAHSPWVQVSDGRVTVRIDSVTSGDVTYIFRQHDGNKLWQRIGSVSTFNDTVFIDTFPFDPDNDDTTMGDLGTFNGLLAIGSPAVEARADTCKAGYGLTYPDSTSSSVTAWYAVAWIDTIGNSSDRGAPSRVTGQWYRDAVEVTDMPTNSPVRATKKLLLRTFGLIDSTDHTLCSEDTAVDLSGCFNWCEWFIVDTLELDATTYEDSMPACSIHITSRAWSDSTLHHYPTDVVTRNGLAANIGHPLYRNRLGLSRAYYPGNWPPDKFIDIPSSEGDWFVKMSVEGDDALLLFRQNSIVRFTGFVYYEYRIFDVAQGVGASSPQSVVAGNDYTYFAHSTGVYRIPVGGAPERISFAIGPLWDSLSASYRTMIGSYVDGRYYWLSTGDAAYGTLIWDEDLLSWRRYSFTFDAVFPYDTTNEAFDYGTSSYLMLARDSLWLLGQGWIDDDSVGDAATDSMVVPVYRSKEYLLDANRERIFSVDITGYGPVDSIKLTTYRDGGVTMDSVVAEPGWSVAGTARQAQVTRFKVDEIVTSFGFEIECYADPDTGGYYNITSAAINWQPWDKGKLR